MSRQRERTRETPGERTVRFGFLRDAQAARKSRRETSPCSNEEWLRMKRDGQRRTYHPISATKREGAE
ncbi:hypothetical protein SKAU_G00381100 [Synaphobranchus kaupii]|uniref:Uncharacterized protein n=1 Tax=Synaphobranchus kaupii TaxID=118154 RepID=A0A9Q1EDN8_SYNKA|nr:hypothetical protein SKAU_G00381100 [Synaphobranchus kaupii]